jgi:hypothetical protein
MNSLLEKEGMAGQVQMAYIDAPCGMRYGSNFQPFVNRRDVKNGKDEDFNPRDTCPFLAVTKSRAEIRQIAKHAARDIWDKKM